MPLLHKCGRQDLQQHRYLHVRASHLSIDLSILAQIYCNISSQNHEDIGIIT
jgi:hypothetical protein